MMADDEDTNQEGIPSHPSEAPREASERDLFKTPKADGVRGLKREAETGNESQDDGVRTKWRKMEGNHFLLGKRNSEGK